VAGDALLTADVMYVVREGGKERGREGERTLTDERRNLNEERLWSLERLCPDMVLQ
jgi:hypothetical protein